MFTYHGSYNSNFGKYLQSRPNRGSNWRNYTQDEYLFYSRNNNNNYPSNSHNNKFYNQYKSNNQLNQFRGDEKEAPAAIITNGANPTLSYQLDQRTFENSYLPFARSCGWTTGLARYNRLSVPDSQSFSFVLRDNQMFSAFEITVPIQNQPPVDSNLLFSATFTYNNGASVLIESALEDLIFDSGRWIIAILNYPPLTVNSSNRLLFTSINVPGTITPPSDPLFPGPTNSVRVVRIDGTVTPTPGLIVVPDSFVLFAEGY